MERKIKTVAIIQARMGSSRLPGKVLLDLCGKPLLWHIVNRLKRCSDIDEIVISTSVKSPDIKIVRFAEKNKIKYYRGSENDVLKRFIDTAEFFGADYVVRITGDAPLVDPDQIDRMVRMVKAKRADYCALKQGSLCVHEGFEVASLPALRKAYAAADCQEYHREHVTIYIKEHLAKFKIVYFKPLAEFQKQGYRFSVDTPSDLEFMRAVYSKLWRKGNIVSLKEAMRLLKINPQIRAINAHVSQKTAMERSRKIAFLIEGGEKLGFGHFTRTSQIAGYLSEEKKCGCFFITNNDLLFKKIKSCNLKTYKMLSDDITCIELKRLVGILQNEKSDILVIDIRSDKDCFKMITGVKRSLPDIKVVLVDNATKARLLVDKNIYPVPTALISKLSWKGYRAQVFSGLQFFPLKKDFIEAAKHKKKKDGIVVTMGSSDPYNLTEKVIKSLTLCKQSVSVILGCGYRYKKRIEALVKQYPGIFQIYNTPDQYAQILASARLVITALGVTVYELASLRVPVAVVANYPEDRAAGKILQDMGICYFLGYHKHLDGAKLKSELQRVWLLAKHSKIKVPVPDDQGIMRMADVILKEHA